MSDVLAGHSQLYPVSNVEVTRGGRVVLPASYKPTSDISDYVIVWNFNVTKQVGDQLALVSLLEDGGLLSVGSVSFDSQLQACL